MTKKDFGVFAFFLVSLVSYLIFVNEDEANNTEPNFLYTSQDLKKVKRVVIEGEYKNKGEIYRKGRFWIWKNGKDDEIKVDPTRAIDTFLSVVVGREVDKRYIPSNYFHKASKISMYFSETDIHSIELSQNKSVTGELYLKIQKKSNEKYYLIAPMYEKVLRPRFVEWIGSSLFTENLNELQEIRYFDRDGKLDAKLSVGVEKAEFKSKKYKIVMSREDLLLNLKRIQMYELYPADLFNLGERIDLGISFSLENVPYIELEFLNSKKVRIIKSAVPTKENFIYHTGKHLIGSGLASNLRVLKENFVDLIDPKTVHKIDFHDIDRIECEYLVKKDKRIFEKDNEGYFSSKTGKFKAEQIENYFDNIFLDKMFEKDEVERKLNFCLRTFKDGVVKSEIHVGYFDDNVYLSRPKQDYFFQASELSKLQFGKILKLCYGSSLNE